MSAKLTSQQEEYSKAWLHDVFVWGGLLKANKRPDNSYRGYLYQHSNDARPAQIVCQGIKTRPISNYNEMTAIDKAILKLSDYKFVPSLVPDAYVLQVKRPANMLCKYIANFCAENGIIWDDSNCSSYEIEEVKKLEIGKALYDFGCCASQQKQEKTAAKASNTSSAGSTPRTSTGAPTLSGAAGKWTSSQHSQEIVNLIGQPHQKVQADGPISYCIEADKINGVVPKAFVRPVNKKAQNGTENIVYFGVNRNAGDCKCWFDDLSKAQDFLAKCEQKFSGGQYTNIHISKAKSDANGYFLVRTEFGDCAIQARNLMEDLNEDSSEMEKHKNLKLTNTFMLDLDNINEYEDAFLKEL